MSDPPSQKSRKAAKAPEAEPSEEQVRRELAEAIAERDRIQAEHDRAAAEEERARTELARVSLLLHQTMVSGTVPDPEAPVVEAPGGEMRKILATNLRVARAALDINLKELAARSGLSRRHLGQIEMCATSVTVDTLETIARALNTSVAELLTPRRP